MAKKSKASVKTESLASGEEATNVSFPDLKLSIPKAGIIDFYYLFGGLGILTSIFMILYLLNHYVFHIL